MKGFHEIDALADPSHDRNGHRIAVALILQAIRGYSLTSPRDPASVWIKALKPGAFGWRQLTDFIALGDNHHSCLVARWATRPFAPFRRNRWRDDVVDNNQMIEIARLASAPTGNSLVERPGDIRGHPPPIRVIARSNLVGIDFPRFSARRSIPLHAFGLKKYRRGTSPVSKISDNEHTPPSLWDGTRVAVHSDKLSVKHAPCESVG